MEWHFFPQKLSQRRRNSGKTASERPLTATQHQKRPNLLDVLGLRKILYGRYFIVHSVDSIFIYSVTKKVVFYLRNSHLVNLAFRPASQSLINTASNLARWLSPSLLQMIK